MGLSAALGIGAISSIAGSVIQSGAASDAANAAAGASAANNAVQQQIYQTNTANETPSMARGNAAGDVINGALGLGDTAAANSSLNSFLKGSGYNFALNQGINGVTNNYALRGALGSGAAMKGVNDYAQGMATNNAFAPWMAGLENQQGTGLSAANALAGVGTNYANAVSSSNNNAASAIGNASLYSGNATANTLNNLGSLAGINSGLKMASSYGG